MLLLTRRPGQTLLIGDTIEIEVIAISGKQVKLGISAPGHMAILRAELVVSQAGDEASALTGKRVP